MQKKAFCIHAEISLFCNHAKRDSCAGPFLGVVQKKNFLEIYSPLQELSHLSFRKILDFAPNSMHGNSGVNKNKIAMNFHSDRS